MLKIINNKNTEPTLFKAKKILVAVAFLLFIIFNFSVVIAPQTVLAGPYDQGITDAQKIAGLPDPGSGNKLLSVLLNVLDKLTFYLAILFVLATAITGVMFILGEGAGQIDNAKKWLSYSIIGLIIALCAYSIVLFVTMMLNPGESLDFL